MTYARSSATQATDYSTFTGVSDVNTAYGSSAAATQKVAALLGVGFGDRGYGETTPSLAIPSSNSAVVGSGWNNLRLAIANIASYQGTAVTLNPPSAEFASGAVIRAEVPATTVYDFPTMISNIDTNRFNFQVGNMTVVASAASTTRGSTWGAGNSGITCEFSVTFADENAARYFFNTGGEIRISLSHPDTSTSRNSSWNAVLNGFICAFRANATARTGGSFGTAQAIGYYELTTSYQTVIDGTNTGVSPYTVNDFFVDAKASAITGLNGAKGSVLDFRVRLIDEQTNAFSDIVASGTVATLGHLRGTSGTLTAKAAPTCAVLTAF